MSRRRAGSPANTASAGDQEFLHRRADVLVGIGLPEQLPRLWPIEDCGVQMKIFKNIVFILALCSFCSKAVMHTYRHFNPPEVTVVAP
jgi:hypothetical protein